MIKPKIEYKDDTLTIHIGIPTVDLTITSTPIVAHTRKIKGNWSVEFKKEMNRRFSSFKT